MLPALVLTFEINMKNIRKLAERVKCDKCRIVTKTDCSKLKNGLRLAWIRHVVEPFIDLLQDHEDLDMPQEKLENSAILSEEPARFMYIE